MVRNYRRENNLTQGELGQAMRFETSMISRVEAGDRPATVRFAMRFAKASGMNLDYVFYRAGLVDEPPEEEGAAAEKEDPETSAAILEYRQRLESIGDPEDRAEAVQLVNAILDTVARRRGGKSGRAPRVKRKRAAAR